MISYFVYHPMYYHSLTSLTLLTLPLTLSRGIIIVIVIVIVIITRVN